MSERDDRNMRDERDTITPKSIAPAIREALISLNEMDRNFELANVVDGLFAIARAINRLADAVGARVESKAA